MTTPGAGIPFYSVWSDWSDCDQTCGATASRSRTRECKDSMQIIRLNECLADGPDSQRQTCDGLPDCTCTIHPCEDSTGQLSNRNCNPDGSDLHTCYELYDVEQQTCLLKCFCAFGFQSNEDNTTCSDVDECAMESTACYETGTTNLRASTAACINEIGSYSCLCADGYYQADLVQGRSCVDIDECADSELNDCDDPQRATCNNTAGGFNCQCKAAYQGDGRTCLMDRFILSDYSSRYDSKVSGYAGMPWYAGVVTDVTYLTDGGIRYEQYDASSVLNSMFATKSGVIMFSKYSAGALRAYVSAPGSLSFAAWSSYTTYLKIYYGIVGFIGPYWSANTIVAGGGIYTKFLRLADDATFFSNLKLRLSTVNSVNLEPAWAYIVTWDRMMADQIPFDTTRTNSYQAIVFGDAAKSTIYSLYIYQDRKMNYNLAVWGSPFLRFYPARIGGFLGSTTYDYAFSALTQSSAADVTQWIQKSDKIIRPDRYKMSGEAGSVSSTGHFLMNFLNQSSWSRAYAHPGLACKTWIDAENQKGYWGQYFYNGLCASTFSQFGSAVYASWRRLDNPFGFWFNCLEMKNPIQLAINDFVSPRCCYSAWDGSLLSDSTFAARALGGKSLIRRNYNDNSQDDAYINCCGTASYYGETPASYCDTFMALRPPSSSRTFIPPQMAQSRGDPHITTLDGLTYTFNGLGEFVLMKTSGFELQGRTQRVLQNGTEQSATVFTGFAGKVDGGSRLELRLNSTRNGVELLVNGTTATVNWTAGADYTKASVLSDGGSYVLAFGNSVQVTIAVANELMTVSVTCPAALKGNLTGLMGNFNDNTTDEFQFSNGTFFGLGQNVTEQELYPYGLTWRVDNTTSLFTYDSIPYASFNNGTFTPVFFDPDLLAMFGDETRKNEALAVCNGGLDDSNPQANRECYFDFKVTGSAAAAAATASASKALESSRASLANFAPTVTNSNVTIQVIVGQSYPALISIGAYDQNDDVISYVVGNDTPVGVSVNSSGVISWSNVQYSVSGSLQIIVTDGKANASFQPSVAMCNCKNGASCLFNSSSGADWYIVPCSCRTGWVGQFCDEDKDGCADKPCFTACTDVAANKVESVGAEFTCDPCPAGLIGDGRTCYDENECLTSKPCQYQNLCQNTAGSFICRCPTGYALNSDGRTCKNIDECLLGTHSCNVDTAVCIDIPGSWNCTCKPGYAAYGSSCLNINECSTSGICGANSKCADTLGSYRCDCDFGYKQELGKCVNIDECSLGNKCAQTCVDGIGAYTCACSDDYTLNPNDLVSCIPKRVCSVAQKVSCDGGNNRSTCALDAAGTVLCTCPIGYALNSTKYCVDINECETGKALCSDATSTCVNTEASYKCQCKVGFQLSYNGITCEDMNECAAKTSNCSQSCTNTAGSFVCSCLAGYKLNADGKTCDDVDECGSAISNACDPKKGICNNQVKNTTYPLGYTCGCSTGYTLSDDGFSCNDLNECNAANRGGCKQGCINSIGSYSCYCGPGYTMDTTDAHACVNINECASDVTNYCLSMDYCDDTTGSYTCRCPALFKLKSDGFTCESIEKCESTTNCSYSCNRINETDICQCPRGRTLGTDNSSCVDIDECATGANLCNSSNNVACSNTDPAYTCICSSQFFQKIAETECIDIDECAAGTYTCGANSYCENRVNGYNCTCEVGYISDGAGGCIDNDECLKGLDTCDNDLGICKNIPGSYECSCVAGYQGDGITCEDVDECSAGVSDCDPRAERSICNNTIGSYVCGCRLEYSLTIKSAGQICDNINECNNIVTYNVDCEQICVDIDGGFYCSCVTDFKIDLDGVSCTANVLCSNETSCDQLCVQRNGTDVCLCNPGYVVDPTDDSKCIDEDECKTGSNTCDQDHGICTNTLGSFSCTCNDGYIMNTNYGCLDRNGGWGAFGDWGNCSTTCGEDGVQMRTRQCNNPAPAGDGLDCGTDDTEEQSCNLLLCEAELENGVALTLGGLTVELFKSYAKTTLINTAANTINEFCSYNGSQAQLCCGIQATLNIASKHFTTVSEVSASAFNVTEGIYVVLLVGYDDSDGFCDASVRRKRTIINLDQSVLLARLSDPTVLASIKQAIESAVTQGTGKAFTLTISQPMVPSQFTTIAPKTVAATTVPTAPPPLCNTSCVIAVAVVVPLVVIGLIIIIVVLVVKKPSKVASSSTQIHIQVEPAGSSSA